MLLHPLISLACETNKDMMLTLMMLIFLTKSSLSSLNGLHILKKNVGKTQKRGMYQLWNSSGKYKKVISNSHQQQMGSLS